MSGTSVNALLAHCITELGFSYIHISTIAGANDILSGLYFNGTMIADRGKGGCAIKFSSDILQVRPGGTIAELTNILVHQCREYTTAKEESVYTCAMMNSLMMNNSVRFVIYLNGRSELFYFIYSNT